MRVAVIGAGASGLACIKTCLEEGLQPVCFEQTDAIGGLWQFTEDENRGCVYRNTVNNTSKEMNPYSDFPLPREFPPYQHYPHMLRYFEMYARHFDLNKHIRLEHEVVALRQKADFHDSGKWEVDYRDLRGQDDGPKPDAVRTEVFDAVMVSTGHHASPAWPSFPGMEEFTGVKIHSHTYKDFKKFVGKKVLVVGELIKTCILHYVAITITALIFVGNPLSTFILSVKFFSVMQLRRSKQCITRYP